MRIRRLKKLVRVMQALPDDIKNREALKSIGIILTERLEWFFDEVGCYLIVCIPKLELGNEINNKV
jgi:hypothetical protein